MNASARDASPLLRLPGLVDLHVHLRDPGQTQKEDFYTGTSAALAGGFTTVVDMPNNVVPVTSVEVLEAKRARARSMVVSDIGFHFGSLGDNLEQFDVVRPHVRGLKLYLNTTTGGYIIPVEVVKKIYAAWGDPDRPILVHAEADVIAEVLKLVATTRQPTHVCHVSSRAELEPILAAKQAGLPVTCGVTPHHLFLNQADVELLKVYARMKPELKSPEDVAFLWQHLSEIDVVESDHAPHTHAEKASGAFGVPGLETTLPLLLQAVQEGRLTQGEVVRLCATGPRHILGLQDDPTTYIEIEPKEFIIPDKGLQTKCGWTPFAGRLGWGRVRRTVIRGMTAYENLKMVAQPGTGRLI